MAPSVQRDFDPANLVLYARDDFYTPEDIACASKAWPRDEVEAAFTIYRAAVDVGDHQKMADMLTADGRGGNSTFGFMPASEYLQFLTDCWLAVIPNTSVWHVIEGGRILNRWCETLPGTPPGGGSYDYVGINELIYAGDGRVRWQYSVPELFPMSVLYGRWKADGQHETYGDIYPGLAS